MSIQTISWVNGHIKLIDQTKLPHKLEYIHCRDVKTLWQAIKCLSVRGAPALGAAAAFGGLLGAKSFKCKTRRDFDRHVLDTARCIGTSRPTAVNLFNALHEMEDVLTAHPASSVAQMKGL